MYYFAYGSNMNWTQMAQRCPSARFVSVARLKDHRFAITRQSRRRLWRHGGCSSGIGERSLGSRL